MKSLKKETNQKSNKKALSLSKSQLSCSQPGKRDVDADAARSTMQYPPGIVNTSSGDTAAMRDRQLELIS